MLGYAYAVAGRRQDALKVIEDMEELSRHRFVPSVYVGFVHVGLGDIDSYFRCAEKSLADRSLDLAFLRCSPLMAPVRADPRYRQLLERLKLV